MSQEVVVNNYGFMSEGRDYPWRRKKPNQYVVGIFGGSVAQQIYMKGRQRIIDDLKKHEYFKNKEIVVLCFSQPGYKQPQQLLALTYFLSIGQELDMVVNLDGFNELALSKQNTSRGIAISMPSAGHMLQMMDVLNQTKLDSEKIAALANISRDKQTLNRLAEKINRTRVASINYFFRLLYDRTKQQYQQQVIALESLDSTLSETSAYHLNAYKGSLASSVILKKSADYWAKTSILMNKIAAVEKISYIHILQPNQYYTDRVFGAREAKIALNEKHIYKPAAQDGYPFLVGKLDHLSMNGVKVYSGLDILIKEPEIVYADDCCHFNPVGINIIAGFIAKKILDTVVRLAV